MKTINDLNIRCRLLLGFGVLLLLFVTGTFISLKGLWSTGSQMVLMSSLADLSRGTSLYQAEATAESSYFSDTSDQDFSNLRDEIEELAKQSQGIYEAQLREIVSLLDDYSREHRKYIEASRAREQWSAMTGEAFSSLVHHLHEEIYRPIMRERNDAIVFGLEVPEINNNIQDVVATLVNALKDARLNENAYLLEGRPEYAEELFSHLKVCSDNLGRASFLIKGSENKSFHNAWAGAEKAFSQYNHERLQELLSYADSSREARQQINSINGEIGNILELLQFELQNSVERTVNRTAQLAVAFLGLGLFVGLIAATLILRSVLEPIEKAVELSRIMGEGDFATEFVPDSNDEMGIMLTSLDMLRRNVKSMIAEISDDSRALAASAANLSDISTRTAESEQTLTGKTSMVAAAAEESSANTVSVATSMEQASSNLASVASATEEMSATINEIASKSEKARYISSQAGEQASAVSTMMQQLGSAAQEIGKVTETINNISSQTNLLALNATIEAARAGAAGKGFAVVANEIKELAKQTAEATEDIKGRISGVQTSAGSAIGDIEKITGVIMEVGHIVAGIAVAIEQQAAVTQNVAHNISQATYGVQEANERLNQTASVSRTIAQDVASVDLAAGEIRAGGQQVQSSAAELSNLAAQLQQLVSHFKI